MVAVSVGVFGAVRVLKTRGWDHVRPVGMQKTGKEAGRRDVSGVGIGLGGRWKAEGSLEGRVRRRAVGGSLERRVVNASRYFAMVYLMGGIASMLWRGSTGVVRKVLLILRTVTF